MLQEQCELWHSSAMPLLCESVRQNETKVSDNLCVCDRPLTPVGGA